MTDSNQGILIIIGTVAAIVGMFGAAQAMTLEEAVSTAVSSSPAIGQSIDNRRAVEWELRQSRGLFLPRVDLEVSAGLREIDSPGRRAAGIAGDALHPSEVGIVIRQSIFNAGNSAEVEYQASRVDGASIRVEERAETTALDIALTYHEIRLREAVIGYSEENIIFHEELLADIVAGTAGGALTIADQRQAEERFYAAQARLIETREELEAAGIRFQRLVGQPVGVTSLPPSLAGNIPVTIDAGLAVAASGNPNLRLARADIDSAQGLANRARADFLPEVFLEGRVRGGNDIDGFKGRSSDYRAAIILRWNLYNGGIAKGNVHEQTWRVGEQWNRFYEVQREVEAELRLTWTRRDEQLSLIAVLEPQLASNQEVVVAYRDQFTIGRRSLLDLLNAQNTLYNSRVLLETARSAVSFAEYRIVKVTGSLLNTLGTEAPEESGAYNREASGVPPTPQLEDLQLHQPPSAGAANAGFFGKL